MKRSILSILVVSLVLVSCQSPRTPQTPTAEPISPPTQIPLTSTPAKITDIKEKLKELDGKPCNLKPGFTCVTLTVPLDHFDLANPKTINIVFAVSPARGERKGFLFMAYPGGPGGEGVASASTGFFLPSILEQYDLVFFDQRGIGLSNPLECKTAYADYFLGQMNADDSIGEEGFDTLEEQQAAIQTAKSFVDACITEIGIDPAELQFYRTVQVAEDIESFRQAIGDDKFTLYGDSYGTQVAQTYARSHPEHLSGLILDGTIDTTLSRDELDISQIDAFNMVLSEVFKACDANPDCSAGMDEGSQAAYDELAQKLAQAPIQYSYPISAGKKADRFFTLNMLDFTASYQLYGENARWELMRAIASAKTGDMIPLVRLYYQNSYIDARTGKYLGDDTWSDTMFYLITCSDDAYYGGTQEEKIAKILAEGKNQIGIIPRLDVGFVPYTLVCTFVPSAPVNTSNLETLKAEGVPTFVLNATLDPATPFHEGKSVFENLADGYHIYVEGGIHVSFGRGYRCPDKYIEDFLLKGIFPEQREIICDWGNAVIAP